MENNNNNVLIDKLDISDNLNIEGQKYIPAYFVHGKGIRCECSVLPPGYGWNDEQIKESEISAKYKTELIATAVNSCKEINPGNPLKVAELLPNLIGALKSVMAELQCYDWSKETFPVMESAMKLLNDIKN